MKEIRKANLEIAALNRKSKYIFSIPVIYSSFHIFYDSNLRAVYASHCIFFSFLKT